MLKHLTVGMATYDDYQGVWTTVQSIKSHHLIGSGVDFEILVVDNNPESGHGEETKKFAARSGVRYETFTDKKSTSVRNEVFARSQGKYVICLDSHVMLMPGAVARLLEHWIGDPESNDILSGPMMSETLAGFYTNFKPEWRGYMYGIWDRDPRAESEDVFEIPMMGLGAFACRREAWPGFNPHFVGFGAEEGYIHEKFRIRGGKALCVKGFQWIHRFGSPDGVKYPMVLEDRAWNYIVGWMELYRNPDHEMIRGTMEHFKDRVDPEKMLGMVERARTLYGI